MKLHHLTFINSRDEELDQLLMQEGAIRCWGFYDFVVATNDATRLIGNKLRAYDSSSITLIAHQREISDAEPLLLATLRNRDKDSPSWASGCYDAAGFKDEIDPENILAYQRVELEGPIVPRRAEFIPLSGRQYRPARTERSASDEEVEAFIENCSAVAEFVDDFNPTLIYAPARGAKPIIDTTLRFTKKPYQIHYPVTSSFVRNGRQNNRKEILNIFNNHVESADRLLYAEEMVSGGMTRGHYREIMEAEETRDTSEPVEVKVAGLVHRNAEIFSKRLKAIFMPLEKKGVFLMRPTPNLFTLDDNRQLAIHYLEYRFGPHCVPYGDRETTILGQAFSAN